MKKLFTIFMLGVLSVTTLQAKENNFNFKQDLMQKKSYKIFGIDTYSELNSRLNGRTYLSCFDTVIPNKNTVIGDFRVGKWGDSVEDIKRNEHEIDLYTQTDVAGGYCKVMGIDMATYYYFNDEGLYQGIYVSNEEYSDKNNYITDYEKLKKALIEKYGQPKDDRELWTSYMYDKENREDYGMAVATDGLKYFTTWEIDGKTQIGLYLSGEGFKCNLLLGFEDMNNITLRQQQEEKTSNDTSGL